MANLSRLDVSKLGINMLEPSWSISTKDHSIFREYVHYFFRAIPFKNGEGGGRKNIMESNFYRKNVFGNLTEKPRTIASFYNAKLSNLFTENNIGFCLLSETFSECENSNYNHVKLIFEENIMESNFERKNCVFGNLT